MPGLRLKNQKRMVLVKTATFAPRRANGALLRALRVDLSRSVLSRRFLLGVCLMLAWMFANGATNIFIYGFLYGFGIPYTFNAALTGEFGLGMILLVIATVPYSTSFLSDRESGFASHAIERVGLTAFTVSRVISVAVSAFLAFVAAAGLFLLGLCLSGAPHTIPGNGEYLGGDYLDLVVQAGPWCYYLVRFTISGLTCAMAAVFSLYISTWIPNGYVVLLSPLIAYYAYGPILGLFYRVFHNVLLARLFSLESILIYQVSTNNAFAFLWAVIYQLTIILLCGWGFCRRSRKEQGL